MWRDKKRVGGGRYGGGAGLRLDRFPASLESEAGERTPKKVGI